MSGQTFVALCACAIGIALLVVTFAVPPTPKVVYVPVLVPVQPPPAMPLIGPGGGHPLEAK